MKREAKDVPIEAIRSRSVKDKMNTAAKRDSKSSGSRGTTQVLTTLQSEHHPAQTAQQQEKSAGASLAGSEGLSTQSATRQTASSERSLTDTSSRPLVPTRDTAGARPSAWNALHRADSSEELTGGTFPSVKARPSIDHPESSQQAKGNTTIVFKSPPAWAQTARRGSFQPPRRQNSLSAAVAAVLGEKAPAFRGDEQEDLSGGNCAPAPLKPVLVPTSDLGSSRISPGVKVEAEQTSANGSSTGVNAIREGGCGPGTAVRVAQSPCVQEDSAPALEGARNPAYHRASRRFTSEAVAAIEAKTSAMRGEREQARPNVARRGSAGKASTKTKVQYQEAGSRISGSPSMGLDPAHADSSADPETLFIAAPPDTSNASVGDVVSHQPPFSRKQGMPRTYSKGLSIRDVNNSSEVDAGAPPALDAHGESHSADGESSGLRSTSMEAAAPEYAISPGRSAVTSAGPASPTRRRKGLFGNRWRKERGRASRENTVQSRGREAKRASTGSAGLRLPSPTSTPGSIGRVSANLSSTPQRFRSRSRFMPRRRASEPLQVAESDSSVHTLPQRRNAATDGSRAFLSGTSMTNGRKQTSGVDLDSAAAARSSGSSALTNGAQGLHGQSDPNGGRDDGPFAAPEELLSAGDHAQVLQHQLEPEAVVSESTKMIGHLESGRSLRMNGTFTGELVSTGSITVGTTGSIAGDLKGLKFLHVEGQVTGDVVCERVVVIRDGKVFGNITAMSIMIGPQATVRGRINVVGDADDLKSLCNSTQTKVASSDDPLTEEASTAAVDSDALDDLPGLVKMPTSEASRDADDGNAGALGGPPVGHHTNRGELQGTPSAREMVEEGAEASAMRGQQLAKVPTEKEMSPSRDPGASVASSPDPGRAHSDSDADDENTQHSQGSAIEAEVDALESQVFKGDSQRHADQESEGPRSEVLNKTSAEDGDGEESDTTALSVLSSAVSSMFGGSQASA